MLPVLDRVATTRGVDEELALDSGPNQWVEAKMRLAPDATEPGQSAGPRRSDL